LTLEVIQDRWRNMLQEQLKRMRHSATSAIVLEGFPTALNGTEIHLVFPVTHEFHYRNACGKHKPVIEEALTAILGQAVTIACSQGDLPPTPSGAPSVPLKGGDSEDGPGVSPVPAPVGAAQAPPEAPVPPEAPAPPTHEDAVNDAVRRTLELFEGSQELPER
jgi:hypothetical protein